MLRYVKNGMLLLSVAYIVIGMLLLLMPETCSGSATFLVLWCLSPALSA